MCLAIPGKVVQITEEGFMRMAEVDFGGVAREVCLAYVPEAGVGDFVLVHIGFAISKVEEEEAQETLSLMEEVGVLEIDGR